MSQRPGLVVQGVMGPLLAVSVHVDALHMVYAVQVSEPTLLRVYGQPLGQPVREVLEVGPHTLELRRSAGSLRIFLRSHDLLAFVERGSAHWTVRIEVSAAYLMTHGLEQAMGLANELADALGIVKMQSVGRADLACDMAGAYLHDEDLRNIIAQRNSNKVAMARIQPTDDFGNELSDDDICTESDVRAYRQGNRHDQLTGLVLGAGGAISMRCYDKRRELSLASRTHKREPTEALWRAGGWDGQAPVFRTEFQLRGRVLKQLEITDPKDLLAKLDAVWQYCVRWCRIIVPGTNNRLTRCDLDPRWQLLQSTYFRHKHVEPAKRVYRRGGQRAEVAVSGCMSALAAHGVLLAFLVDPDKVTAEALFSELKGIAGARLARIIVDDAVSSHRVDDVWTYFATRARCYRARYSSVDDSPAPEAEAA